MTRAAIVWFQVERLKPPLEGTATMANPRMTLLDLLNKAEQGADPEFLRDGLKLLPRS